MTDFEFFQTSADEPEIRTEIDSWHRTHVQVANGEVSDVYRNVVWLNMTEPTNNYVLAINQASLRGIEKALQEVRNGVML